jgi:hypothetical protein
MSASDSGLRIPAAARVGALTVAALAGWVAVVELAEFAAGSATPPALTPLAWFGFLWIVPLFTYAGISGREPPSIFTDWVELGTWLRGTHPGRASAEEREALTRLGIATDWRTSAGEARRLIRRHEGRLPPTLQQHQEMQRYGIERPPMTRASAERLLADFRAEAAWDEAQAWAAGWMEAGVEIAWPQAATPRQRADFDAAWNALAGARVPYPLPGRLDAWDLAAETARMQLALELPGLLHEAQRELCDAGVLRRELRPEELREFIPGVVQVRRIEWDIDEATLLRYLVARDRPALLGQPWARGAFIAEFEEYLRWAQDPDAG